MRLVLIEWEDSHGSAQGWTRLDDCTADVLVARSVGWLLHDLDTVKVIVPHLVEPDESTCIARQGRGEMTIPARAVLRMVDLQERVP